MREDIALGAAAARLDRGSNYDTDRIWRDDRAHFVHPFTHFDSFKKDGSLVITGAKGAYITDFRGKRYLDGIGGLWCMSHRLRRGGDGGGGRRPDPAPQLLFRLRRHHQSAGGGAGDQAGRASRRATSTACSIPAPARPRTTRRCASSTTTTRAAASRRSGTSSRASAPITAAPISRCRSPGRESDRSPHFHYATDFIHHVSCPYVYRRPEGMSVAQFCDHLVDELEQQDPGDRPRQGRRVLRRADPGRRRRDRAAAGLSPAHLGDLQEIRRALRLRRGGHRVRPPRPVVRVQGRVRHRARHHRLGQGHLVRLRAARRRDLQRPDLRGDLVARSRRPGSPTASPIRAIRSPAPPASRTSRSWNGATSAAMCARSAPISSSDCTRCKDLPLVGDVRGSHFMMCTEYVANKQTRELLPDGVNIGKRISNHCEARGLIVRPLAHLNIMSPPLVMTEARGGRAGRRALPPASRRRPTTWCAKATGSTRRRARSVLGGLRRCAGRSTSWRSPPPATRRGDPRSRS